ncbi:MAG: tRNA pseudouridine(55) synthase TruB [Alphaproteobacteria bacterium]
MGRRNKKGDKVSGWVNVDKPLGLTSTQVIGKIRRIMNAQKVGHAGTLDPLASGVLPIALGEATKTIPYIQDAFKTYEFTVTWGEQRSTDDAEGDVVASSDTRPALADIEALLPDFTGEITQTPPQFSAVKIDGQRAYDLARKGEAVEIKQRDVFVESLEIVRHPRENGDLVPIATRSPLKAGMTDERLDDTSFVMTCSKGTYVRSIARDMGVKLGCYGYVSALRRTAVGDFYADDAILLDNLMEMDHIAAREAALLPVQVGLDDIPALALNSNEVAVLRNGQALSFISKSDFHRLEVLDGEGEALAVFQDQAVAIVEIEGPSVKPVRVFNI